MMTDGDAPEFLTVDAVNAELQRFLQGAISSRALAKWAFDNFSDEEEELLEYEPGKETLIASVLDDLIWADSAPFTLDQSAARRLLQRLHGENSVEHA